MASQQEKAFRVLRFEASRSVITVQRVFRARFRNVASSQKMSLSTKSFSSIFNCISSQKSRLFTLPGGERACTNRIFYGLKHRRLRNTFHDVIFGMSNSQLDLATDLRGLR
jgi:hypothetical protein